MLLYSILLLQEIKELRCLIQLVQIYNNKLNHQIKMQLFLKYFHMLIFHIKSAAKRIDKQT